MKITITPCILFLWLFAASCHFEENRRLKEALSLAGDNRSELEKFWLIMPMIPRNQKLPVFSLRICRGIRG